MSFCFICDDVCSLYTMTFYKWHTPHHSALRRCNHTCCPPHFFLDASLLQPFHELSTVQNNVFMALSPFSLQRLWKCEICPVAHWPLSCLSLRLNGKLCSGCFLALGFTHSSVCPPLMPFPFYLGYDYPHIKHIPIIISNVINWIYFQSLELTYLANAKTHEIFPWACQLAVKELLSGNSGCAVTREGSCVFIHSAWQYIDRFVQLL